MRGVITKAVALHLEQEATADQLCWGFTNVPDILDAIFEKRREANAFQKLTAAYTVLISTFWEVHQSYALF